MKTILLLPIMPVILFLRILIYVDDLLIIENSLPSIIKFKEHLSSNFT